MEVSMSWTVNDIPSQAGKLALITGATGGLGFETARALARAGATVVLTGRNPEKGAAALRKIVAEIPRADVSYESLDLSELRKVSAFADAFARRHAHIDILVENAGVMAPPTRGETPDGFELQFGTNYLGHFALTAQLLPLLINANKPRVVTIASIAARNGRIHFDDLQATRGYRPYTSYGQSKLAMLMHALELQRRSDRNGWGITAVAAHPGVAHTELIQNGPGHGTIVGRLTTVFAQMAGQPATEGALPQLYAATMPDVIAGGYYGPDGFFELKGDPRLVTPVAQARDSAAAARLWDVSEVLTGRLFPRQRLAA
jgi:NAD(P)-dependent dehydrogenase (short-subunit alcohol dehydrogenase family)